MIKKKIVVLYHNDCRDGFSAAWAAWKKFGARAEYVGVEYHLPPPEGLFDKELYFVDFSYNLTTMESLLEKNRQVVVIDHHISRQDVARALPETVFNLHHSGAGLAWQYFHPHTSTPWFLRYVEESDLWRFRLPHTREILLAVDLLPRDFSTWSRIARDLERPEKRTAYAAHGKLLLQYEDRYIRKLADHADEARFLGHRARVVNSPILRSQIGNDAVKRGADVGIVWYENGGTIFVSLRSSGTPDVAKLAKRLGGGGHRAAAGFELRAGDPFPWKFSHKNHSGKRSY